MEKSNKEIQIDMEVQDGSILAATLSLTVI